MKRINTLLIGLALAIASAAAQAEWVEVERFDDGMRVYADPASARRDGDQAQLQHLVRWNEAQVDPGIPPYLSTRVQMSYDCRTRHEMFVGAKSYAGAMGNGPTVDIDERSAETWDSISPGSMEEKLWRIACAAPTEKRPR